MKRKLTLTALVMAASLPVAVFAQSGGSTYQEATNPNSRTEAPDPKGTPGGAVVPGAKGTTGAGGDSASMFKELDRDKDGQVSKDEAKRSADVQARFDQLDSDRDGKVSMTEWNAGKMK